MARKRLCARMVPVLRGDPGKIMFAIRIKPNTKSRPKTGRGCVWVNETLDNYTTRDEAMIFETRHDAEHQITEPWETVIDVGPKRRPHDRDS